MSYTPLEIGQVFTAATPFELVIKLLFEEALDRFFPIGTRMRVISEVFDPLSEEDKGYYIVTIEINRDGKFHHINIDSRKPLFHLDYLIERTIQYFVIDEIKKMKSNNLLAAKKTEQPNLVQHLLSKIESEINAIEKSQADVG